jgi:hypothetical protein
MLYRNGIYFLGLCVVVLVCYNDEVINSLTSWIFSDTIREGRRGVAFDRVMPNMEQRALKDFFLFINILRAVYSIYGHSP